MSTERRRSAEGGRRRAGGPDDGPRGDGGRRRADGPPREQRDGGRRRPEPADDGGFWGGEETPPRRRQRPPEAEARSEGRPRPEGGRRRAEGDRPRRPDESRRRRPEDGDRPRRRPEDGERPRRRPEDGDRPRRGPEDGERPRRRPDDPRAGGRRRAAGPRDPRERDREHGSRSEGRRPPGRGGRGAGGGGGGGRRRSREEEPDDRHWFKRFMSKAWKPALAFCGLMFIGGVAAFAVLYAMAPDADDLDANAENDSSATQIYWAGEEGDEELALTTGEVKRVVIERDAIPESVVNGVLAAEQRTFYEDPGINIMGIGRALLSGGEAGGGSTITQQMARNYYSDLQGEEPLTRKIREIFISIKLSQQVEHDEILTIYLNTIYFGRGASGIEMAAQEYFGKSVSDLDEAEGAYLGLIIQMPSNFENPEEGSWTETYLNDERWPYVQNQLATMHEETNGERGLPRAEAESLEIPETIDYNPEASTDDPKLGYVRQAVINEVEERYAGSNVTGADIATKGLVIKTSLDPELMTAAEEAFDVLPASTEEDDDTMRGLTAVDPTTGQIVAFNGGPNVAEVINNSLVHQTQAGSAYKPYVLARALADGISLNSRFDGDSGREFLGLASPVINSGERDYGEVDLIQSTADSVNTSFVELAIEVGETRVDELAVEMGVHPDRQTTSTVGPLIALGTHQVNTLDMASGYSTFAAEGRHFPAHMVTELQTAGGEVITPDDADEIESGEEIINQGVAADSTYAMQQAVLEGGASNAALDDGRPVAGKTGTSSDAVSAWFVGYTPQLSTAVGLSRFSGEPLDFGAQVGDVFGGTTSAMVWKDFMETAMEGREHQQFPEPQWVGEELSYLPTPTPSETPEEEEEPTEEPTEEESETECDPREPDCETEESPEDCEPGQPGCDQSEGPEDPEDCGDNWFQPDCEDEDPPGIPGQPGDGNDQNQGNNNSLIRPRE
ncbi:transglycosylase domain-containing protein [Nocardiopsis sp. MG754419]|uniref:transglycosylase domain-containing protein n=1 Tax=Nocardiopsis sp. MG754419 TaxID=2259865 RepID=UPI001BA68A55|nr:transglycosylase domain-containing protein [Nocardiopsis sp. MG754419]MBR8741399.1 glycosyl transferase family 51 [Nocardiopsis sp. MG754419]